VDAAPPGRLDGGMATATTRPTADGSLGVRPPLRRVTVGFMALFVAAHAVWAVLVNLGFRARVPGLNTLSANLLGLALLVAGLLFGVGRLRPADVGLRVRDLPSGLLFTLAYFVAVQAAVLVYAAATGARVVNDWAAVGAGTAAYLLAAQLLGNALYEEVVFRGFLLPQLFLELRGAGTALALVLAPVVSQALFAVAHVPNRLWVTGLAPGELPGALLPLFLMGLFFALLYLLTDNLFAVVGVHALNNEQMLSLLGAGGRLDGANAVIVAVLALALAVGWRLWRARAGVRARGGWPSPGASAA